MESEKNVNQQTTIMTAEEVSRRFFGEKKSAWAVLTAARKRQIPSFKIGRRVYFDYAAVQKWALRESEASMSHMTLEYGIRRL